MHPTRRLALTSLLILALGTACTGTFRLGGRAVWLGHDDVAVHGVIGLGLGGAVDGDERAVIAIADTGLGGRFDPTVGHLQGQFGADYVDFSAIDYRHEGLGWRVGARFGAAADLGGGDTVDPAADAEDGDAVDTPASLLIAWPLALLWVHGGSSGGGGGKYGFNLSPDELTMSVAFELMPIWLLERDAYDSSFGLGTGVFWEVHTIEAW